MEIIGILIVAALAALSAVVATSPLWGFAFLEALAKKKSFLHGSERRYRKSYYAVRQV